MCATGALLNMLGPMLEAKGLDGQESKRCLVQLLASALTLSIIERCFQ